MGVDHQHKNLPASRNLTQHLPNVDVSKERKQYSLKLPDFIFQTNCILLLNQPTRQLLVYMWG